MGCRPAAVALLLALLSGAALATGDQEDSRCGLGEPESTRPQDKLHRLSRTRLASLDCRGLQALGGKTGCENTMSGRYDAWQTGRMVLVAAAASPTAAATTAPPTHQQAQVVHY